MYLILLFMMIGYTILYRSLLGGCLTASLFLILLISVLLTRYHRKNFSITFQLEKEKLYQGQSLCVVGTLAKKSKVPGRLIQFNVGTKEWLHGKERKKRIVKVCPKGNQVLECYRQEVLYTDAIELNLYKVKVKDYTGSLWIPMHVVDSTVLFVRPKLYPLEHMIHRLDTFQEKVWDNLEIKEYQPGDKLSRIHWKLLASKQNLFIKNVSADEESTLHISLIIPEHFEQQQAFFSVLYSVGIFFLEYQMAQVYFDGDEAYEVSKEEDLDYMFFQLYTKKREHMDMTFDWNYQLMATSTHIVLEGMEGKNFVSLNRLEEIKAIKL